MKNTLGVAIVLAAIIIAVGLYFTFAGKKAAERECTVAATTEAVQPANTDTVFGLNTGSGGGFRSNLYDQCMQKRGY